MPYSLEVYKHVIVSCYKAADPEFGSPNNSCYCQEQSLNMSHIYSKIVFGLNKITATLRLQIAGLVIVDWRSVFKTVENLK